MPIGSPRPLEKTKYVKGTDTDRFGYKGFYSKKTENNSLGKINQGYDDVIYHNSHPAQK